MTRRCACSLSVLLVVLWPGVAPCSELSEQLSFFEPLLGETWVGHFDDPESAEFVHVATWESALDGQAVSYHKDVEAAEFSMEALYYWDPTSTEVAFVSVTNRGQVSAGTARETDAGIELLGESRTDAGTRPFRYVLRFCADGTLEDLFFSPVGDGWTQGHLILYSPVRRTP